MKKEVGLYLGVESIGIAVTQGKSIVSLFNFAFSSLEETKNESLPDEVRWEALINRALREASIESGDVNLTLADKDFIFRALELPLMNKKDAGASVMYEVEKYIPFRVDELEWAYEATRAPKEKKTSVSFVGIKGSNLEKVRDILNRLKIKVSAIEPSCLSLARVVKSSKKLTKLKNYALLDISDTDSNLTFFQNDLPIFNRHLVVPRKEDAIDVNKFVESVDFSFQYFKREFKSYSLEKLIVVGEVKESNLAALLEEGLQSKVEAFSPYELTSRNNASVESVKALGAAVRNLYPAAFKPVFRRTKAPEEVQAVEVEIPPLKIGVMIVLLGIGAAVGTFLSIYLGNQTMLRKAEISEEEEKLKVPDEFKKLSWEERKKQLADKQSQLSALRKLQGDKKDYKEFFDVLDTKSMLPEGLWLTDISISGQRRGTTTILKGMVRGSIFLDDDYEEKQVLDELISNLKVTPAITTIFSEVNIDSSRRETKGEFEVTTFSVTLE